MERLVPLTAPQHTFLSGLVAAQSAAIATQQNATAQLESACNAILHGQSTPVDPNSILRGLRGKDGVFALVLEVAGTPPAPDDSDRPRDPE